jgi:acyl-CoA reductase-like NAD-dependent aldehyde dehydrogenase
MVMVNLPDGWRRLITCPFGGRKASSYGSARAGQAYAKLNSTRW